MVASLMKFLSGLFALAGRCPNNRSDDLAAALTAIRSQRDTNLALIRERRLLQRRLREVESMSDADRGNEHAAELDRVKAILLDRHGLSVSRAQVASAVQDLSDRLAASRTVLRKLDRVVDVASLTF